MTTSTPDVILFDLDGTLIDTAPDFFRTLNIQRALYGLDSIAFKSVRKTVSDGARALIRLSFDITEDHPDFELLRQEMLTIYLDQLAVDSRLFEGFDDVLETMEARGIRWGIVTNKPRIYSERLLEQLGLSKRIATLICPDDVRKTKPHPEPLFKAADLMETMIDDIWYVGDHGRDIEAGKRAGMKTVAAAYGYVTSAETVASWQADHIINSPTDLLSLIHPG